MAKLHLLTAVTGLFLFSNVYSKEFIIRIEGESLLHESQYIVEKFDVLGKKYAKAIVPDQEVNSFKSWMNQNFTDTYYEENISYDVFDSYENGFPVEPDFYKLWGLENKGKNEPITLGRMSPVSGVVGADIGAREAWSITQGNKDLIIAVIDTGIDYRHPDLNENIWANEKELNGRSGVDDDGNGFIDDIYGHDFANNDSDPMDDHKHGTHVAGIIGSLHNGMGSVGVMANVSMMAVKFADKKGRGSMENALKAINYAVNNGAKVLSNSWGSRAYSKILEDAILEAHQRGVVFVAAAGNFGGNNNDTNPIYPASYKIDNVISVGAFSAQDYPSAFSCYGPKSVHVSAPGTNILSTVPGNGYAVYSGTSQATPFVSGIVGLALSIRPEVTPLQMRNLLIETSVETPKLKKKNLANGRVHGGRFLKELLSLP